MTESLFCVFPGCGSQVVPEKAWVPELKAIRRAEGKSLIFSGLARHVHCDVHANLARREGVKMFRYSDTLGELERRTLERAKAKEHFAKYALPPEPETAMGAAFRKAGTKEQKGKVASAASAG